MVVCLHILSLQKNLNLFNPNVYISILPTQCIKINHSIVLVICTIPRDVTIITRRIIFFFFLFFYSLHGLRRTRSSLSRFQGNRFASSIWFLIGFIELNLMSLQGPNESIKTKHIQVFGFLNGCHLGAQAFERLLRIFLTISALVFLFCNAFN